MTAPIIWHNPRCSKSRAGLALLQDLGHTPVVRLYLQDPPSLEELRTAQKALGLPVSVFLRSSEAEFKATSLTKKSSDSELLELMAQHPKLIERPIVFWQGRAVVGRPTEAIASLFAAPNSP